MQWVFRGPGEPLTNPEGMVVTVHESCLCSEHLGSSKKTPVHIKSVIQVVKCKLIATTISFVINFSCEEQKLIPFKEKGSARVFFLIQQVSSQDNLVPQISKSDTVFDENYSKCLYPTLSNSLLFEQIKAQALEVIFMHFKSDKM